jgi:hypothetical protein
LTRNKKNLSVISNARHHSKGKGFNSKFG